MWIREPSIFGDVLQMLNITPGPVPALRSMLPVTSSMPARRCTGSRVSASICGCPTSLRTIRAKLRAICITQTHGFGTFAKRHEKVGTAILNITMDSILDTGVAITQYLLMGMPSGISRPIPRIPIILLIRGWALGTGNLAGQAGHDA